MKTRTALFLFVCLLPTLLPIPAHAQSHLWSKRFGSTGSDQGFGVAVDSSGNVLATGFFEGTVNFGGGNLTSAGSGDIFLLKLAGTTVQPRRRGQITSE